MDINVAQLLIALLVLLFSLTVHESAHAWTADRLGDPTARMLGRVSLNPIVHIDPVGTIVLPIVATLMRVPIIGWAKPVPVRIRNLTRGRQDYLLVAAAGPASNLLLAVAASVILRLVPVSPLTLGEMNVTAPLAVLCRTAIEINVLLAVFNMIPIPPLDGGNVLSGLLSDSVARGFDLIRPYGFLLIYALMITGVLSTILRPPYYFLLSWLL